MSTQPRYTVGTYWINDFTNGTNDKKLEYADDKAQGFGSVMRGEGHTWKFDFDSNGAKASQFISWKSKNGVPYDHELKEGGVDTVEFAYIMTHGGARFAGVEENRIYYFIAAFGTQSNVDAKAFLVPRNPKRTHGPAIWVNNTAKLGDKNLRWLVLDSCESMQLPGRVTSQGMELDIDPIQTWYNVFYGINMIFGFTGYSSHGSWNEDMGSDFAECICDGDSLSEAWTDEAYSYWLDNYPVALAVGKDQSEATKRLHGDRLNNPVAKLKQEDILRGAWLYRK